MTASNAPSCLLVQDKCHVAMSPDGQVWSSSGPIFVYTDIGLHVVKPRRGVSELHVFRVFPSAVSRSVVRFLGCD